MGMPSGHYSLDLQNAKDRLAAQKVRHPCSNIEASAQWRMGWSCAVSVEHLNSENIVYDGVNGPKWQQRFLALWGARI